MKKLFAIIATVLLATGSTALVLQGYEHGWTGFPEYVPANKDAVRAKTLWDWLDLLIVPTVLAVAAFLLEGSRKRSDQAVESDRQRQQTLEAYLDYVSELLLAGHLFTPNAPKCARKLVRTKTLVALRLLDGSRKAQVLQFLYEARLIDSSPGPVISLNGADLKAALLDEATLSGAEIRGAYFNGASIRSATLRETDLRGSDFSGADFTSSDLTRALLVQAKLAGACLRSATLKETDMSDVDLTKVRMTYEQRREAKMEI
ncbi:pentapeptide repeat-containing protein [Synechococcus sp. CCAP 1479/9]|uniref:pentapeptide repeat-containing protein n=1 Tax=Synechococcus sp. CCAP 1479/9 TaxID=1221593 RepID=UPI001C2332F9|nr:pentapeptide repeat-containing protein [Synechococcus sp. CCAP 1479/9]